MIRLQPIGEWTTFKNKKLLDYGVDFNPLTGVQDISTCFAFVNILKKKAFSYTIGQNQCILTNVIDVSKLVDSPDTDFIIETKCTRFLFRNVNS